MKTKQIYLDSHASTPVDQDVLSAMLPYFTEHYGNGNHRAGWKTTEALEYSRFQVAQLLGAKPSEIIFTSGATEAINLALLGLISGNSTYRNHIVTQRTEHKAVLNSIAHLKAKGYEVSILDVDRQGRVSIEEVKKAVTERTLVVAIMLANNEIGTVQPIKKIGEICSEKGAKFFCDITQGIGWYPIDMGSLNIDLAVLSAHKFYGPRGVGALYIKKNKPRTIIEPLFFGGGQEKGLRSGTSNIPGIVGMGEAANMMSEEGKTIFKAIKDLRDYFQSLLMHSLNGITFNGCQIQRHPGNLNMHIPHLSGEQIKEHLPNVIFSNTSACSSHMAKPSHVLEALQSDSSISWASFRIGIGKYNTREEIDTVAKQIIELAHQYHS